MIEAGQSPLEQALEGRLHAEGIPLGRRAYFHEVAFEEYLKIKIGDQRVAVIPEAYTRRPGDFLRKPLPSAVISCSPIPLIRRRTISNPNGSLVYEILPTELEREYLQTLTTAQDFVGAIDRMTTNNRQLLQYIELNRKGRFLGLHITPQQVALDNKEGQAERDPRLVSYFREVLYSSNPELLARTCARFLTEF